MFAPGCSDSRYHGLLPSPQGLKADLALLQGPYLRFCVRGRDMEVLALLAQGGSGTVVFVARQF